MEMTTEQKRAIALAKARQKAAQATQPEADMSFMGRVKDNIIGVDDGVMSTGEKLATALNVGGESLTLGVVGDEAAAAADAMVGRGTYDERLARHRGNEAQFREENPKTAFAAEIAPALIPGAAGAKLVKGMSSVLGRTGAGAALGTASGGTYGFMEGEGDDRVTNAGTTVLLGSIVGGAAPKVMDVVKALPKRLYPAFKRAYERPSVGSLKAAKNAAYKAVDESGEVFSGDDMGALYQTVQKAFNDGNYVDETDNASRAVLKILERRQGQDTTISQLDSIRQNLWKRYGSAKDQPVILDAIKSIDDLIESRAGASELMGAARAANSRYAKSQLLEDAFTKAQDQTAGTGSGGNILNKYRQAVTSIINDKNKAKFFDEAEIDLMRKFVRGSKDENFKRLIGKLSPDGNGLMMALHVVGGMASSGATLPLMAVGGVAKRSADNSVQRGANQIQNVLAGMPMPVAPQITAGNSAAITGAVPLIENSTNALADMNLLPR